MIDRQILRLDSEDTVQRVVTREGFIVGRKIHSARKALTIAIDSEAGQSNITSAAEQHSSPAESIRRTQRRSFGMSADMCAGRNFDLAGDLDRARGQYNARRFRHQRLANGSFVRGAHENWKDRKAEETKQHSRYSIYDDHHIRRSRAPDSAGRGDRLHRRERF